MKDLHYSGFNNNPSKCGYGAGQIGASNIMVFEHKNEGTSPQNMIEELTTTLFNKDFPGTSPSNLRVFEADFSGTGLFKFQEVIFQRVISNEPKGFLNVLKSVFSKPGLIQWHFSEPKWKPLSSTDELWLSTLISQGQI